MGNVQGQPQELVAFKKLPEDSLLDTINIPEKEHNRSATNSRWLIALLVCFLVMLPFVIYTLVYADPRRYFGYDSCGNICGSKNSHYDGIDCSGTDMTNLPYLKGKTCVEDCGSNYAIVPILNVCIERSRPYTPLDEPEVHHDSETHSQGLGFGGTVWQMVVAIIFSLILALTFLFLFRHALHTLVWSMIIACFLMLIALTGFGWYYYSTLKDIPSENTKDGENLKQSIFILVLSLSIIGVVYLCMLAFLIKKINLVIKLLKESTKAVFSMPGLTGIPILALFVHMVIAIVFVVLYYFMISAGKLQKIRTDSERILMSDGYTYQPDVVMQFTYAYVAFMWFWLSQIVVGVNYMTISGAVSKWYFTRNKSYLEAPISTSARITFKFHLGTAVFGGFIITLINFIKAIILSMIKNRKIKALVECCADALEEFFKFLSKNAYIITAMHGEPFLKSGKRAAKLIFSNLKNIIAVNSIGDFILGMTQFLIILITILFFALLLYIFPAGPSNPVPVFSYVVVFIVSAIVAGVTFGVFETTIDTIFICYCEDSNMNDGMARPYFMSRELMEFIEDSKKVYDKNAEV